MADNDMWLTLGEAVAATGWKPERIRSLARRGTIPRRRGNGRDWLYQVTPEVVAARAATRASVTASPSADTGEAARWQAVAAELQEELLEVRVAQARLEGEVNALRDINADLRSRLDRAEAELAEARRPWWQRMFPRSAT